MFFFIAGIQPKVVDLNAQPALCASCGLYRARLKRVDHYLSFFFLPILPVRRGRPFLQCENCGSVFDESGQERTVPPREGSTRCHHCGKPLEPGFRYCPSCGNPVG